jgi:hypothetical protein
VLILSVSFKTQSLRSKRASYGERAQCIADNFEVTWAKNGDYIVPRAFQNAAKGLASAESVEKQIIEAIISNCGSERSTTKP